MLATWNEIDPRTGKPKAAAVVPQMSESERRKKRAQLKADATRASTGEAEYAEAYQRVGPLDAEISRLLGVVNDCERQLSGDSCDSPLKVLDRQAEAAAELASTRKQRESLDAALRAIASQGGNTSSIVGEIYGLGRADLLAAHRVRTAAVEWCERRIQKLQEARLNKRYSNSPSVLAEITAMETLLARFTQETAEAYAAVLDE